MFVALFFLYLLPHLIILFSWGNAGTPPGLDAFECLLICTRDSIHAEASIPPTMMGTLGHQGWVHKVAQPGGYIL